MKREEGVVAVVVALCLVVLMGGVALTLDVGSLLYRRREMVNGADAAALAAAMECARDKGIGAATAAANDQFEGNSPGSKNGYTLNTIVAEPDVRWHRRPRHGELHIPAAALFRTRPRDVRPP